MFINKPKWWQNLTPMIPDSKYQNLNNQNLNNQNLNDNEKIIESFNQQNIDNGPLYFNCKLQCERLLQ